MASFKDNEKATIRFFTEMTLVLAFLIGSPLSKGQLCKKYNTKDHFGEKSYNKGQFCNKPYSKDHFSEKPYNKGQSVKSILRVIL